MISYYPKSKLVKILCPLAIITALTIYSCRKNLVNDTTGNPVTYQVDLNALKLSYTNDTLTAKVHVFDVGTATATTTRLITDLNVKWDKLYYARRKDSRLLEFNLESIPGVTTPGKPDSSQHLHYADKASLVFLQFDNKTEMRFLMKVIETVKDTGTSVIQYLHYNNIPATFTGRILYYSIDKRFINGWYYENGKPKSEFLPQGNSSANGKTVQSMAGGKNNSDIIMHCQDWYWFYSTGEIEYIETTCVEEIRSDGNDSGGNSGDSSSGNNSNCNPPSSPQGPPSTPPDGGFGQESYRNVSVSGGNIQVLDANGCPPDATPPTITNNVTDPCLRKMVEAAISRNIQYNLQQSMNGIFNSNTNFNLSFVDGVLYNANGTVDTNTDGATNVLGNPDFSVAPGATRPQLNGISIRITLNNAALVNASQEFVTATILHEALHAYFRTLNISFDHDVMYNEYIPWFVSSLQTIYPSLSSFDAKALAYGGLTQDTGFSTGPDSSMLNNYLLDNTSFKTSQSGTPCQN